MQKYGFGTPRPVNRHEIVMSLCATIVMHQYDIGTETIARKSIATQQHTEQHEDGSSRLARSSFTPG